MTRITTITEYNDAQGNKIVAASSSDGLFCNASIGKDTTEIRYLIYQMHGPDTGELVDDNIDEDTQPADAMAQILAFMFPEDNTSES